VNVTNRLRNPTYYFDFEERQASERILATEMQAENEPHETKRDKPANITGKAGYATGLWGNQGNFVMRRTIPDRFT
jgi:hypothetical protein